MVLVFSSVGGCREQESAECGDGRYCPPQTRCAVDDCIVERGHCDSFSNGALCQLNEGRGQCQDGVCEIVDSGTSGAGGEPGDAGPGGAGGGGAAGTGGAPAIVTVSDSCSDFTPCGGDLVGAWISESVCAAPDELFARALAACPTATIDEASGTLTSRIEFTETTMSGSTTSTLNATATWPPECVAATCPAVEQALGTIVDFAACSDVVGGGCECTVRRSGATTIALTYTANGTTLARGDGRTFRYCVENDELVYDETTPPNPGELAPGIYRFRKE